MQQKKKTRGKLFSHARLMPLTGLTIIMTYETNLAKIVAEEQELANVANLLDLPVSVFPEVFNIQKEMKALRQIYDLYKAQKVCIAVLVKTNNVSNCEPLLLFCSILHVDNNCDRALHFLGC